MGIFPGVVPAADERLPHFKNTGGGTYHLSSLIMGGQGKALAV